MTSALARWLGHALLLASVLCQTAAAAVLRVGPGEPYQRIADAARAAQDGDTVEIMSGDYRGDAAVWTQRQLTIRGVGTRPVLHADGRIAEGKAIWVLRHGDFRISNIEFRGARASDGNGAGIRLEHGRLEIDACHFIDNQNGILTANFEDTELSIKDSLFAQAPHQHTPPPHLLYVGRIKRFTISGSRFHQGYSGHLLKSRARHNDIRYNLLYDGPDGEASYEIDLPNGGHSIIIGNIIGQSATTQNPVIIAYGAEGHAWPDSALYLSHNTLISERPTSSGFLRIFSQRLPEPTPLHGINNLTLGPGALTLASSGRFHGNVALPTGSLQNPAALDFRPRSQALLGKTVAAATTIDGIALTPQAQFRLPGGTEPLPARPHWLPGAVQ